MEELGEVWALVGGGARAEIGGAVRGGVSHVEVAQDDGGLCFETRDAGLEGCVAESLCGRRVWSITPKRDVGGDENHHGELHG